MFEITNEELYYNTPMYPHSKRAPINIVYKTITHLLPGFSATQMKLKAMQVFGVTLSTQLIGHALKTLEETGYVENRRRPKRTWSQSYYYKTAIYVNTYEDN